MLRAARSGSVTIQDPIFDWTRMLSRRTRRLPTLLDVRGLIARTELGDCLVN